MTLCPAPAAAAGRAPTRQPVGADPLRGNAGSVARGGLPPAWEGMPVAAVLFLGPAAPFAALSLVPVHPEHRTGRPPYRAILASPEHRNQQG